MLQTPAITTTRGAATLAVAADPAQVSRVRAFIGERAQGSRFLEVMLLAASELAANAITHSRPAADGTISVEVSFGAEQARVAVTDGGHPFSTPHLRQPQADDEGGRGLQLVDALATHWGFTRGGTASTTWCEFGCWPQNQ